MASTSGSTGARALIGLGRRLMWRASQSSSAVASAGGQAGILESSSRSFASLPPHIVLGMPALSPTMAQGNIAAWHVKEGDAVSAGTVLADIETDKATLAFENQDDGFVARLLKPAGARDVAVGEPVAVIVEEAEHVAAFADYQPAGAPGGGVAASSSSSSSASAASSAAASGAASTSSSSSSSAAAAVPANYRISPAVRFALAEAGLSPGDIAAPTGPRGIITKGDVLAAVAAGVKPGAGSAGKTSAAPQQQAAAPSQQQQQQQKPAAAPAAAPPSQAPKQQQPQPRGKGAPRVSFTDVPNSQVRRIIAKRLLESKQTAPSLYVTADAPLAAVQALRQQLASQGTKVSVNDCVVRAVALALRDVPEANSYWDAAAGAAAPQPSVDVAIAVATDGGLITPIVRGADGKPLARVAEEIRDLAARARANKLKPEEFMGGSFSVSNLGMFGLGQFSAIINPPQAAILAVGGSRDQVALGPGGEPGASPVMAVTLSADHRVFDGELAARFLAAFSGHMANPFTLIM